MHPIFLVAFTFGGTIIVLRILLGLLGLGFGGHDVDFGHVDAACGGDGLADGGHDGHGHDLGRIFTFQAMVSFLAFFGVGGLSALEFRQPPAAAVLIGVVAGLAAVFLLGYAFGALRRLDSDGAVRIANAVGLEGKVYLRIPGGGEGEGKIALAIQGRIVEVPARTPGPGLRAGDPVVVSRVLDAERPVVEVVLPERYLCKPASFADAE